MCARASAVATRYGLEEVPDPPAKPVLQASTVAKLALQASAAGMQAPFWQTSLVEGLLSESQGVTSALGILEHTPVFPSQRPASWHWSAPQTTGLEPVHVPLRQVSTWVHAFPSLQGVRSAFAISEH